VIILLCFYGKQSIVNSPVANFEVTQQGSVGMFIKYHMAVFLAIFGITMLIQFISYFFESIADYKNEKGNIELIYKTKKYGIPCERRFEIDTDSLVIGFVSNGCF